MKRIAIDTTFVNSVVDTDGALNKIQAAIRERRIVIKTTQIVEIQLGKTPDADRRRTLLETYAALPKETVIVEAGTCGQGLTYGNVKSGDGRHTGISLEEAKTTGRGAGHDASLAVTASGQADVFVTDDRKLARTAKGSQAKCEVWSFKELLDFLQEPSESRDINERRQPCNGQG